MTLDSKVIRRIKIFFVFTVLLTVIIVIFNSSTLPVRASVELLDSAPSTCLNQSALPADECNVLVDIYEANPNGAFAEGWLVDGSDPCTWSGVTCYTIDFFLNIKSVGELNLSDHQLTTVPVGIGKLKNLRILNLNDNQLAVFPAFEVGDVALLRELHLDTNQFASMPEGLENLESLNLLSMRWNKLTGEIPVKLSEISGLETLNLRGNQLRGEIPVELSSLVNLETLWLPNNQLVGEIPTEIGNLSNLVYLSLGKNQLSGEIPKELGNLSNLWRVDLDENELTGEIPAELGNLTNIAQLWLDNNHLTGSIPAELGDLTSAGFIALNDNKLTGEIPVELGNLTGIGLLHLHNNDLSGPIPVEFSNIQENVNFAVHNTNVCMPDDEGLMEWIDTGYSRRLTGYKCGQPKGKLSGSVKDEDGAGLPNIQVSIYGSQFGFDHFQTFFISNTVTDEGGKYEIEDLGEGVNYFIKYLDLDGSLLTEYYDNRLDSQLAKPVAVTLGVTTESIDAVLGDLTPQPPLSNLSVSSGSVYTDSVAGTFLIQMSNGSKGDVEINKTVLCGDSSTPNNVFLDVVVSGSELTSHIMIKGEGNQYSVLLNADQISTDSSLVVRSECVSGDESTTIGTINLYDPSGIITDAETNDPIKGAKVRLYKVSDWFPKTGVDDNRENSCESNLSKTEGALWSQIAPTDQGILVDPQIDAFSPLLSMQLTDENGYYGWDVSKGCWYVVVEAEGYESLTSPVVGVPPEVVDLNLKLTRLKTKGATIFLPMIVR